VRSVWLQGAERYQKLFDDRPPAQFCERVLTVNHWFRLIATAYSD
jgi:hypothetical protein